VYKVENNLMKQTILNFDKVYVNQYPNEVNKSSRFIEEAARSNNIRIQKSSKEKKLTRFLYEGEIIGSMNGLKPSSTSKAAFQLCRNKFKLENFLRQMHIKTLESQFFNIDEKNSAYDFIRNNSSNKFVLKPLSLAGGLGIELNIDEQSFSEAWDNSMSIQKANKIKKPSCIIQPFIHGFDVRVSIIEGTFISATLRLPAHIVGNGEDSIEDLISQKNRERSRIRYFKNKLINIDEKLIKRLAQLNYTPENILEKGEILILTDISNLTLGGESIDITNNISSKIVDTALKATAAIPGLQTSGIDFMVDDYIDGEGYIIEVNTNANHTIHHVPLKGDRHYPFHYLVQSLLVKYKVESGIILNESESEIMKKIWKFKKLKEYYAIKLFEASILK